MIIEWFAYNVYRTCLTPLTIKYIRLNQLLTQTLFEQYKSKSSSIQCTSLDEKRVSYGALGCTILFIAYSFDTVLIVNTAWLSSRTTVVLFLNVNESLWLK